MRDAVKEHFVERIRSLNDAITGLQTRFVTLENKVAALEKEKENYERKFGKQQKQRVIR